MHPITKKFKEAKEENRLAIMTHVVIGYPSITETKSIVKMMVEEGVDFIELQLPFSDPIGDGPTIHKANTVSLKNGTKVADAFALAKELVSVEKVPIPLLFMTYLNIAFAYGLEKFCKDASEVGIVGLIIPDYNLENEEYDNFEEYAKKYNLVLVRFASLDSTEERLKMLAKDAPGFVYCFSTRGVTGARDQMNSYLDTHLAKLHKIFAVPLAVGFGISNGEHVRSLKGHAEAVVVGSAMIKAYEEGGIESARAKTKELVEACRT